MVDFRRRGQSRDPDFTCLMIPVNGYAEADLWGGGPPPKNERWVWALLLQIPALQSKGASDQEV